MQFATLITLTAAASMAVLSAMAAPTPACNTICPTVYQPVCAKAIDGLNKVFGNACELKNYNCKHPDANFAIVADANCEGLVAPACDTVCPTVFQPVCAKAIDGLNKTFGNACELKNYNCKHPNANFVVVAESNCRDLVTAAAAPTPACGTICPSLYQPICAKAKTGLSKTFNNACELKNYNCKHPNANFTVVANANCEDLVVASAAPAATTCDTICPTVYQPVCAMAIDGLNKAFGNACELKNYNCKHPNANFAIVANSNCKDIPTPAPVCSKACPMIYKPVCAKLQSGESKTFGNACEMSVFNCENPNEKAKLVANAECAAAPTACPTACAEIYKPVCAKYTNGDLQTFANTCELNVFNCKFPAIAFTAVTEGACETN
ncbi:hypothetical protein EC991_010252 [Linnemannia zychae]|nr:hypothetical protein EC991_010252 [Linnemannia zychae]